MELRFGLDINWWIILCVLPLLFFLFFWNIKNTQIKSIWLWLVISIRILSIVLLIILLFKPMLIFFEKERVKLEIPILVDHSYSMRDKSIKNKSEDIKAKDKNPNKDKSKTKTKDETKDETQSIFLNTLDDIKNYFSDTNQAAKYWTPHIFIMGKYYVELTTKDTAPTPEGIFDIKSMEKFTQSVGKEFPLVIILSDFRWSIDNLLQLKCDKPVFFIVCDDSKTMDFDAIESVYKSSGIEFVAKDYLNNERNILVTTYIDNNKINTINKTIKNGLNTIELPKQKLKDDKQLVRINISDNDINSNPLSKWAYTEIPAEKTKTPKLYVIAGQPSYDLGFTMPILRTRGDFDLEYKNRNFNLPNNLNPEDDFVIIHDPISVTGNKNLMSGLIKYLNDGGRAVIFIGNSNQKSILNSELKNILPYTSAEPMENNSSKSYLDITQIGLSYAFLNLYDKGNARKIWQDMPVLNLPDYRINLKNNIKILAKIAGIPAITEHKIGQGNVFTIFTSGLWRLDFQNLAYGLDSSYLSQFWDEIIGLKPTPLAGNKRYILPNRVIDYNQEASIYINAQKIKLNYLTFTYSDDNNNNNLRNDNAKKKSDSNKLDDIVRKPIYNEDNGMYSCTLPSDKPGEFIVKVGSGKSAYELTRYYVKYPEIEKSSIPNESIYNKLKGWANSTGGDLYYKWSDLDKVLEKIKKEKVIEKPFPLYDKFYVIILLVFLFTLEWVIRRVFWI